MSVLILGVNLPADGEIKEIILHHDGKAHEYYKDRMYEAIPVPPHGRLIDADALTDKLETYLEWDNALYVQDCIDEAPTIIPAEEGET